MKYINAYANSARPIRYTYTDPKAASTLNQSPGQPTSPATHFFGIYNGVCFLRGDGGLITAIRDRGHGKPAVRFEEKALAMRNRGAAEAVDALHLEGTLPDGGRERDALGTRAACGPEFVPCLMLREGLQLNFVMHGCRTRTHINMSFW
jgi:hypothetical protein